MCYRYVGRGCSKGLDLCATGRWDGAVVRVWTCVLQVGGTGL